MDNIISDTFCSNVSLLIHFINPSFIISLLLLLLFLYPIINLNNYFDNPKCHIILSWISGILFDVPIIVNNSFKRCWVCYWNVRISEMLKICFSYYFLNKLFDDKNCQNVNIICDKNSFTVWDKRLLSIVYCNISLEFVL